jgi:NADP-reducing hydrogenase subunit HndC
LFDAFDTDETRDRRESTGDLEFPKIANSEELIEPYIAGDGFDSLATTLEHNDPKDVLDVLKRSGLRSRTGAGFPTGLKWQLVGECDDESRFVICNGNDGGPGATLSTLLMASDPFGIVEGLSIAAFVVGARQGFVSIPADQDRALHSMQRALEQCRAYGLLGSRILGSDFSFEVAIHPASGALVLRDETALIAAIEGRRATPRPKPPFPTSQGLFGRPTLISQPETLATVPRIISDGGAAFRSTGTRHSRGTKAFLVSGCVQRPGVVDLPMGTPLRDIVDSHCGGGAGGRPLKALQVGGASGGFLPLKTHNPTADFEDLHRLGVSMGSGSLTAIPDDACMVELTLVIMDQISSESCGKCPPCRIGTRVLVNLLEHIAHGAGTATDLDLLEDLSAHIRSSSLCTLGQSAPNNLLSALRFFRDEFTHHIESGGCPHAAAREPETDP